MWAATSLTIPLSQSFETRVAAVQALKDAGYPAVGFLVPPAELVPPAISADTSNDASTALPNVLVPPDEDDDQVLIGRDIAFAQLSDGVPNTRDTSGKANKARAQLMTADEAQLKRLGTGSEGRLVFARWMTDVSLITENPFWIRI